MEINSKFELGKKLSLIGLRMKITKRKEINRISEEVPDSVLLEVFEKKPINLDEFLAVEGARKEIWHFYGDLIARTVRNLISRIHANSPWTPEEDARLWELLGLKNIKELAAFFKRSRGAIRARLQKLELEHLRRKESLK